MPKLLELKQKRLSTDPFQNVPDIIKYQFAQKNDGYPGTFQDWQREKTKPENMPMGTVQKDVEYYNQLPEGPLKNWVKKVIQFRTTGGTGVMMDWDNPGTVDKMFSDKDDPLNMRK
mgnify:CR=1 FL=1